MTYNITLTNGTIYTVIPDGSLNNNSSMTLIGQNYVGGYGLFQNDNFIRLLENGANSTAPTAPLTGQLWFNTSTKTLQVYNGTVFKTLGGATATSTPPTSNSTGDLWYNTTKSQLNVWSGTAWVVVGPLSSTDTGAVELTLHDYGNSAHQLLSLQVNGNVVALVSQDANFTPYPSYPGFPSVNTGINLSTTINSQTPQFTGTATNSMALAGLPSSAFMSTTSNSTTSGTISIQNNAGLSIGNVFTANVVGNSSYITNEVLAGNIHLTVNDDGILTTVLSVVGTGGQVLIAGNTEVSGNINASGNISGNAFTTGTFTIQEIAGSLYFQSGNTYVAQLDATGNLLVAGNVTPNATITPP